MDAKRMMALLAAMVFLATASATVLAYSMEDYLPVDYQTRQQSNWCWAACASCILDFNGQTVSQTSFVNYVLGGNLNQMAGSSSVQSGLSHWGITSTRLASSLSFSGIQAEINTYSRPVYSQWTWSSGGGHAVLLDGYSSNGGDYVEYMDPSDGQAYFVSFAWLTGGSGYNHTWTETLKGIHD